MQVIEVTLLHVILDFESKEIEINIQDLFIGIYFE